MKIPPIIFLILCVACGLGLIWIFQSRPSGEWPILIALAVLGAWLAPKPKRK